MIFVDFAIKEAFYVNGQKTKLISGAVHYFRLMPSDWQPTLAALKAMGCNTVETYVPWNLHEPRPGQFDFSGRLDLSAFLDLAQQLDLMVILRPSPYICAEWEFVGFPAWLLAKPGMRVRADNPPFLQAVSAYYQVLLPKIVPHLATHGGKVIMVQVENEYGSFGNNKTYLKKLAAMLTAGGIDVPLFTADGGEQHFLAAGSLAAEGILPTANFGSDADSNFDALSAHLQAHGLKYPLMCMEFWDGWFNKWGQPIVRRSAESAAADAAAVLARGSINFYMFRGGTNFGFTSGTSIKAGEKFPQVTSYDYDAPLTEWGAATPKFFALQKAIKKAVPKAHIAQPQAPKLQALGSFPIDQATSLFSTLAALAKPQTSEVPLTQDQLGQNVGYTLYETRVDVPGRSENCRVYGAKDRIQVYLNHQLVKTQQDQEIGTSFVIDADQADNRLQILYENQGRVNYGPELLDEDQHKGIRSGVWVTNHALLGFKNWALDLENIGQVDFSSPQIPGTPSFYHAAFTVDQKAATFLDTSAWGKGAAFINGFNLGRYWHKGPTGYLYVPQDLLKLGTNDLVVFETEGVKITRAEFVDHPVFLAPAAE